MSSIEGLMQFLNGSPTSCHALRNIQSLLAEEGFKPLAWQDEWDLRPGEKYYLIREDGFLSAFKIPVKMPSLGGFKIIASHHDSPGIKLKANPDNYQEKYLSLNPAPYGGAIFSTWFDRPLGLAGRIFLKSKAGGKPESRLFAIKKPLALIPSLAIHLQKSIPSRDLDLQKELVPLWGTSFNGKKNILDLVAEDADIDPKTILSSELSLYDLQPSCFLGQEQDFISAGRLDDLALVYASLQALLQSSFSHSIDMMVCFDHEEIGSLSVRGAQSPLLAQIMERIFLGLDFGREDFLRSLDFSLVISADQAHGYHPNYSETSDPQHPVYLNGGPVIKYSANHHYATEGAATALFKQICQENKISLQYFEGHNQFPGGKTLGPVLSNHLNIPVLDMGNPLLGMHSSRELMGTFDQIEIEKAFRAFYCYNL